MVKANYRNVRTDDISRKIKNIIRKNLNEEIYLSTIINEIEDELDNYSIMEWKGVDGKHSNLFWRISIIPYWLLCFVMAFIVCPIKFIITGIYYIKSNNGIGKFLNEWEYHINK